MSLKFNFTPLLKSYEFLRGLTSSSTKSKIKPLNIKLKVLNSSSRHV